MSEESFYYGCCCQTLLLTSFMYTIYDLFQRSKQYLMNIAHRAWWAALDVYITADEFYNQRILPTYNAIVLAKDIAVVSTYDAISRTTDARLPRSIRGHVVGYVNSCRERTLMSTAIEEQQSNPDDGENRENDNSVTNSGDGASALPVRTIPNPFISVSIQLSPSGSLHASVMDDIIIPNNVIQKYCIMGTYIDMDLLDYILHMHCKHLLMGMDVSPDTIDTVTILDNEVNMKVFKMSGPTAQCIVFNEDGTYSIVSREELDDSESAEEREEVDADSAADDIDADNEVVDAGKTYAEEDVEEESNDSNNSNELYANPPIILTPIAPSTPEAEQHPHSE